MLAPDESVWPYFDRFLAGELPFDELVSWLRDAPELVRVLDPDEYVALMSLSPGASQAAREATSLVARAYERHRPGRLVRDRAERIARGMVEGEINVAAGTRALAKLRAEGHEFIPDAFVGIAAMLDDIAVPDEYPRGDLRALPARLAAAKEQERRFRAPALTAATRLLETLGRE